MVIVYSIRPTVRQTRVHVFLSWPLPMAFTLHSRLEADSAHIIDLPICQLRLSLNASLPWLILVPTQPDLAELHDLTPTDRHKLMDEIALTSKALQSLFKPKKINVGMLGNIVSQLHIHVVARFTGDLAWPGPIWGRLPETTYTEAGLAERLAQLRQHPDIVNHLLKS